MVGTDRLGDTGQGRDGPRLAAMLDLGQIPQGHGRALGQLTQGESLVVAKRTDGALASHDGERHRVRNPGIALRLGGGQPVLEFGRALDSARRIPRGSGSRSHPRAYASLLCRTLRITMTASSPRSTTKITRWLPTRSRLYSLPVNGDTCLASEAGSLAYCSILATIRSRSRCDRRRMSRMARIAHSMVMPRPTRPHFLR